jgi:hypothetical protein
LGNEEKKHLKIFDLNPQTAKTIQRIVLELARHPVRPNKCSMPIRLGSKSAVIINPTLKQVQNNVQDNDPTTLRPKRKETQVP